MLECRKHPAVAIDQVQQRHALLFDRGDIRHIDRPFQLGQMRLAALDTFVALLQLGEQQRLEKNQLSLVHVVGLRGQK
ncbi:hypothetical protein D3C71_1986910 [compost metagenome]